MCRQVLCQALILLALCNPVCRGQTGRAAIKEYRQARERAVGAFTPFDMDRRIDLYQAMDRLPRILLEKLQPKWIAEKSCTLNSKAYWLSFYDFDRDGQADQFVVQTQDKKALPNDFGFLYDLNGDGAADYIIYYGGSMITDQNPFYRYFYHWLDTDCDGRIDAVAYSHVVYSEDARPDPNKVFWIMDRDGDGAPDHVDYTDLSGRTTHQVLPSEGVWEYTTLFGPKSIASEDAMFFGLFNEYLEGVNDLH